MAKCVWALMDDQLVEYLITCQNVDARQWLLELMETTREDEFVRILVTLWSIWWARRKAIHEQEFHSPLSTFRFAERYLEDLLLLPKKVTPNISAATEATIGTEEENLEAT